MTDDIEPRSKQIKLDINNVIECSICIENILDEDKDITKCTHVFHKECIKKWLESNNTCPSCKTELKEYRPYRPPNISTDLPTRQTNFSNLTFNHPIYHYYLYHNYLDHYYYV